MSDKVYLGKNVSDLDFGEKLDKISRVNLSVDSDHIYTSGDDTGRTLEVTCPWGSQEMADSILLQAASVNYIPFTASGALLDPAAEIGDGIDIAGVYSVLAQSSISLDKQCASSIPAPHTDEMDDEYPYKSSQERAVERQIAYTKSLITKTSEDISLQVQSINDELGQTLRVAADGVTITNASGSTLTIDGGQIDATKIKTEDLDA